MKTIPEQKMNIQEYIEFTRKSDWTIGKPESERAKIAQYGIAAEIGSLVSAVKKKILLAGDFDWDKPNDEIVEEIGDILWYVSQLADIDGHSLLEVLKHDLLSLQTEIDKDKIFLKALGNQQFDEFVARSNKALNANTFNSLDVYQDIAFLTARTQGQDLLHVCLTRLMLYTTLILSDGFPQVEKLIQKDIQKSPLKRTLGMLIWHISALAKTYNVSLEEVAGKNRVKLNELSNVDQMVPTPLHDDSIPKAQQFPREFSVSFVSVGRGRLQMFAEGLPLGDELTDNSNEDDGYRFHDIMHLANAAKLGWSPVLRSLLGKKRKFDPVLDEVEDGARAKIVEEAIVKAVHSEGERIGGPDYASSDLELFSSKKEIPFNLLRLIKRFAKGLEVEKNRYWEWQDAILEGHQLYSKLREEGQGTVHVDLNKRRLEFSPHVSVGIMGPVVGNGIAVSGQDDVNENCFVDSELVSQSGNGRNMVLAYARKEAVLRSLSLSTEDEDLWKSFGVFEVAQCGISVKASGLIAEAMWKRGAVAFRSSETTIEDKVICSVIAIGNPSVC